MTQGAASPKTRSGAADTWRPLRALVFVLLAVFMLVGPFFPQVLGKRAPFIRQWTMFSKVGLGLADVMFSVRQPDGTYVPVDHYALLGYDRWWEAPHSLRRIKGVEGVEKTARRLCRRLGPHADLRARVRVAYRSGWHVELMEADRNLCRADASP
jgi:hypothetical protein